MKSLTNYLNYTYLVVAWRAYQANTFSIPVLLEPLINI